MDDLISRQVARYAKVPYDEELSEYERGWNDACDAIADNAPSVQPEIIRCKDCKYCEHWYRDKGRCFLWIETGIDVFEDGFCNYAGRRTDE